MEIKDLLDRFELLYPNNSIELLRRSYTDKDLSSIFKLSENLSKSIIEQNPNYLNNIDDLRKAVIEQNLHSIFRLLEQEGLKIDDLRKAVIEQNLHSIFRLLEQEDLKKLVLDDNKWSLWRILSSKIDTQFISAFKYFENFEIKIDNDCFSRGQLKSKLWIINELSKLDLDLGIVFLCAGWYATLATLMFEANFKIKKIRSFDIDPACVDIAERFNKVWETENWKFKAITADILNLNYSETSYTITKPDNSIVNLVDIPDTIVNTSCEHIKLFDSWYSSIPAGKLLILQNNNYFEIEDHINCTPDLNTFSSMTPMSVCLYEGELDLGNYKRFMKIGYR
jgi:hypothetical protein